MINAILQGIMNLIMGLVNVLLYPIDLLIENALPDLSTGLNAIGSFFSLIGQGISWAISVTGLSSECLSLIVLFYTFKLTAPLLFSTIKLAIKWYDKLKP